LLQDGKLSICFERLMTEIQFSLQPLNWTMAKAVSNHRLLRLYGFDKEGEMPEFLGVRPRFLIRKRIIAS
jgi:hypothetical protein